MTDLNQLEESIEEEVKEALARIKEQRDELRVQLHLATMEAREEWQVLEQKWEMLQSRVRQLTDELQSSGGKIGGSLKDIANELETGYQKIRRLF